MCQLRAVHCAKFVQATFRRRRNQARNPPHTTANPGKPVPSTGPGTLAIGVSRNPTCSPEGCSWPVGARSICRHD